MKAESNASAVRWGIGITLLSSFLFGISSCLSRGTLGDGGSVGLITLIATVARGSSLWLYCLAKRKPIFQTRADIRQGSIGGVFQAISTFCLVWAFVYLPVPIVIIIFFSHTLMLFFFMAWRKEIELDPLTIAITVIALAGLTLVVDFWHPQPGANWIGIGLSFLAAIISVSRLYIYGQQTKRSHPAVVGAENFIVAAAVTILAAFLLPLHIPASLKMQVWMIVSPIITVAATFCMFYGIALLGSFRYSLFSKMEPVFNTLFSVILLNEWLKPQQYLGMALVIVTLALYQIVEQKRMKRAL